jgi:hypothetical protein
VAISTVTNLTNHAKWMFHRRGRRGNGTAEERRGTPITGRRPGISKHEIRDPKQGRISNLSHGGKPGRGLPRFEPWDFGPWDLFRVSRFGFRICPLAASGRAFAFSPQRAQRSTEEEPLRPESDWKLQTEHLPGLRPGSGLSLVTCHLSLQALRLRRPEPGARRQSFRMSPFLLPTSFGAPSVCCVDTLTGLLGSCFLSTRIELRLMQEPDELSHLCKKAVRGSMQTVLPMARPR